MNNFTKEEFKDFLIGLSTLILFMICLGFIKYQHNTWKDAKDTDYTIYATFNRTDGLEIGNKVRMSGIDIGQIEDSVIDEDFRATLTLKIRSNIKIPDDSSASIVSSGIMGNKYIEIEPGGSEDYIEENGDFDALYQEVEKEIDDQNAKLAEVIEKYKAVEVAQVNDQLAKVNDHFVLHSSNGLDYQVYIHNVNDYRPPEMLYACDIVDPEGTQYYEAAGDWYFCGQDFIDKCEYVGKEE